jgi:methylase of polypeptide subunit release factors
VTVGETVARVGATLAAAGVPEPGLSSRYLVSQALGGWRAHDYLPWANSALSGAQQAELARLVHCRLARMPLQYIAGHWDFRGIRLTTRPPVFIPRHSTQNIKEQQHSLLSIPPP